MTFTINDFFIDSSVLIEYNKGTKVRIFSSLMSNDLFRCIINETVVSEFFFYFLAHNGRKSPQAIHSSNQIAEVFDNSSQYKLISVCHFLPSDTRIIRLVPLLMAKYNLLPNDAIILACCKLNHIKQLVSHDTDFVIPCKAEGIELLRED
jgi:predicted nucleic acid-binding protein